MTPLGDDELHDLLEERASRGSFDLDALVVEGRRRAMEAPQARRLDLRSLVAGLGGVAAVAAVLLLVVVPLAFRPAASPGPNATGPAASSPSRAGTVTARQLDALLRDPATNVGTTVAFDGALIADPVPCAWMSCRLQVADVTAPHTIVARDDGELKPPPEAGRYVGVFGLRMTGRSSDGRVVLEALGLIAPSPGNDGVAWPIARLATATDTPADLVAATGWIVRTAEGSCPSGQECAATEDYLTAEAYQPVGIDGSVTAPPADISLVLPAGSYDAWAPEPNVLPDGGGVEPRPVTLLLRLIKAVACPTPGDANTSISCYGLRYDTWQVAGRLDFQLEPPVPSADPSAASVASPSPEPPESADPTPSPRIDRQPGGFPRSIGNEPVFVGLDALTHWRDMTDDRAFLVGGWFDSHVLNTCSPPVGQDKLTPFEARGCPRYAVTGIPGRPDYPVGLAMPDGDGPIVLLVHTNDTLAAACTPAGRAECLQRTVVDAVAWFGDASTTAAPIGPGRARSIGTGVSVMEWRDQPDGSQVAVDEDVFTVPIACAAPWPTLLFAVHGDPRYGLIAVFPDTAARERFQAETDPLVGPKCLDQVIERPAAPRWVGHDNVLVLVFADDTFATRLADVLADPQREQAALPMTEPGFDRSLGTVTDYLVARAAGELDHAWAERLLDPSPVKDTNQSRYRGWIADATRRATANALVGRLEAVDEAPTKATVGPDAWRILQSPGVAPGRLVRVVYDRATDPALATETFLVVHLPESQYRDWQLIRVAGEPYPAASDGS